VDGDKPFVEPLNVARVKSFAWARDLCQRHRDELGAVHLGVLAACATLGHVHLASGQNQHLGVIVTKPRLSSDIAICPIIAAAVPTDLQRIGVGKSMLAGVAASLALDGARVWQAVCRADLPSNHFWAAAGFNPLAVRYCPSARGIPLIIWRRRVDGRDIGDATYTAPDRIRGAGGRWLRPDQYDARERVSMSTAVIDAALTISGCHVTAALYNGRHCSASTRWTTREVAAAVLADVDGREFGTP
jgi:hypothetical protein